MGAADQMVALISTIFRSLAHQNYRRYYFAQLVSLNGTWMQHVAQAWLVYRLTDSSFMLGLVSFIGLSPILFFGLLAGSLVDRFSPRTILVTAQTISMIQAALLAVLTLAGQVEVWHVMLLAGMLGFGQALEMPSRHSFIAGIVPRRDLSNAIALNSSLFNSARFIGPAIAGFVVAAVGEGWVFAVNAVSFVVILVALIHIRTPDTGPQDPNRDKSISGGIRAAWAILPVRRTLLLITAISLAAAPYTVLMPVVAREIFAGDASLLGLLLGAAGSGAFLAALWLASRRGVQQYVLRISVAGMLAGMLILLFGQSVVFWISLSLLAVIGFCLTTVVASSNIFIQLQIPDELRGRIMALFSVMFIGMTPIGNLVAGAVAEWLGVVVALTINGVICLMGATIYFASNKKGSL